MPQSWKLKSVAPHDFFLNLDLESYFDHEHNPENMFEEGFSRPIPVGERDVYMTAHFNGDPDNPEFTIVSFDSLSDDEKVEADKVWDRILGLSIDLKPLLEKASEDMVLGPKLTEFYGFKRMARASFFEDAMNRVIQTQISHKPTARKMVYGVREGYGSLVETGKNPIPAWPRPIQLMSADPQVMKQYGLSLRKGEYVVGLADEIMSGNISNAQMDGFSPEDFYERITKIRGVGPTTAQDLMLYRTRHDAFFPSRMEKGMERALRRWIILSYGGNPEKCSEKKFHEMIANWKGMEATALEYLYINWITEEKRRRAAKKK